MWALISSLLLKKNLYDPIFRTVGDIGRAFGSIYPKLWRKALDKKSPPPSRGGPGARKLTVAQVFNLCAGGVLLFHVGWALPTISLPGSTGFQPVHLKGRKPLPPVPSRLPGLTTEFGMGSGVAPWPKIGASPACPYYPLSKVHAGSGISMVVICASASKGTVVLNRSSAPTFKDTSNASCVFSWALTPGRSTSQPIPQLPLFLI